MGKSNLKVNKYITHVMINLELVFTAVNVLNISQGLFINTHTGTHEIIQKWQLNNNVKITQMLFLCSTGIKYILKCIKIYNKFKL